MNQASAQADWSANGNPRLLKPTPDYSGVCNEREDVFSGALKDMISHCKLRYNHMLRLESQADIVPDLFH